MDDTLEKRRFSSEDERRLRILTIDKKFFSSRMRDADELALMKFDAKKIVMNFSVLFV